MSGGAYEYASGKIVDLADQIRVQAGCRNMGVVGDIHSGSSPALRLAFKEHLRKVAAAVRAIEWNDSGDGDDEEEALIKAVVGPAAELETAIRRATEVHRELTDAISRACDAIVASTKEVRP